MRIMTFALVGVLLFLVAMVVLQIFLSRRENKWAGRILPIITFGSSLVMMLNVAHTGDLWQTAGALISVFVAGNIPTAVLLAIYFACRDAQRRRKELNKMNAQDLEGYVLRANTYGTIRVERGIAKKGGVRAAVCPSCGMLVLRMERE